LNLRPYDMRHTTPVSLSRAASLLSRRERRGKGAFLYSPPGKPEDRLGGSAAKEALVRTGPQHGLIGTLVPWCLLEDSTCMPTFR
jgi:hypothetical protein